MHKLSLKYLILIIFLASLSISRTIQKFNKDNLPIFSVPDLLDANIETYSIDDISEMDRNDIGNLDSLKEIETLQKQIKNTQPQIKPNASVSQVKKQGHISVTRGQEVRRQFENLKPKQIGSVILGAPYSGNLRYQAPLMYNDAPEYSADGLTKFNYYYSKIKNSNALNLPAQKYYNPFSFSSTYGQPYYYSQPSYNAQPYFQPQYQSEPRPNLRSYADFYSYAYGNTVPATRQAY